MAMTSTQKECLRKLIVGPPYIRFWLDMWAALDPLKVIFPRLFSMLQVWVVGVAKPRNEDSFGGRVCLLGRRIC